MSGVERTWPENAWPTAEQLHQWVAANPDDLDVRAGLERLISDSQRGTRCFLMNHDDRLDRVSELEAVVERVRGLADEQDEEAARINATWDPMTKRYSSVRSFVLIDDLRKTLDRPQNAQEAAQGDGRGEVGSECADDANVAQMRSKPSPPHRPPPLPNPVWRDGDEKRKR